MKQHFCVERYVHNDTHIRTSDLHPPTTHTHTPMHAGTHTQNINVHTCILLPNNQISISMVVVSVGESKDNLIQRSVQTREHFHCEAQICKHGKPVG